MEIFLYPEQGLRFYLQMFHFPELLQLVQVLRLKLA